MSRKVLRIATRKSLLALWQAEHVKARLEEIHQGLVVELVKISTRGDKILDAPLAKVGGKGLFVKELETALMVGEADIAVHSMKDVPMVLPEGLKLPVICKREDPRDAFISQQFSSPGELPAGAIVGTSSLRRHVQIKALYPDVEIKFLRGNVNTRLKKLHDGEYDAIVLASAGLKRLQLDHHAQSFFAVDECIPAVGQGAIGIECRDEVEVEALIQPLADQHTTFQLTAERAMNKYLNGGCQVPIGGYAELENDTLTLTGLVGCPDTGAILKVIDSARCQEAEALGIHVAQKLLEQGADKILEKLYTQQ